MKIFIHNQIKTNIIEKYRQAHGTLEVNKEILVRQDVINTRLNKPYLPAPDAELL